MDGVPKFGPVVFFVAYDSVMKIYIFQNKGS